MSRNTPYIKPPNLLIKSINQSRELNDKISEILRGIQDEIKSAIEQRMISIKYIMPVNFDISGMDYVRAQKNVYYGVLKALHDSEYSATYEFIGKAADSQKVILTISWVTADIIVKETNMDNYIKKHTNK